MADSPEVKVKVTAEDQGVAAAIRQLGSELKNLKNQQDETASSSLHLKDAFKDLLGVIAVDRVIEFGRRVLDSAVQVGNLADETGLSTEAISVFRHVAEETGVGTENLARSLTIAEKNIVLFEGGSQSAARGMKLLGLQQKDFIGLSAEQKLTKVVEALGRMKDATQQATAAQLVFGRGGRDMIVIANALAAQGFGKIEDELRKMGVLFTQDITDKSRIAQASFHELNDVGTGMAVQLESGLVGPLTDIAEALVKASAGGEGFAKVGAGVGAALKLIVEGAMDIGAILGTVAGASVDVFAFMWGEIEQGGMHALKTIGAVAEGLSGHLLDAWQTIKSIDSAGATDEASRIKAIFSGLRDELVDIDKQLFPSAEEEARRMEERKKLLGLDKKRPGAEGEVPNLGKTTTEHIPSIADAAAKAQLALALKEQQDLLTIWKAGAAQREEVEKEQYERGAIAIAKYFADRRAAILEETAKEITVLKLERDQVQAAADLAGEQSATKKSAADKAAVGIPGSVLSGDKSPANAQEGERVKQVQELRSQSDRLLAEQLQGMARVDELNTQITEHEINSQTKVTQLDAEQFKAEQEQKQKIIAFLKEIDELQGKTVGGAKEEIEAKTAEMRVVLEQAGYDKSAIDQILQKYTQLKETAAAFDQQEKATQQEMRSLELQRADIEIRMKDGKISERQAQEELNRLLTVEIPLLRQKAQLELQAALATRTADNPAGDQQRIAQAQQQIQEIQKLSDGIKQQGTLWQQVTTQMNLAGKTLSTSLTGDFQRFFMELASGTKTAGQAFAQFGLGILQTLEQIVTQMLATIVVSELLNTIGLGGNTSQVAKTIATNDALITSNAGAAGAAAFASVMESVPFPANIALAPATMAAAVSTTLSNLALGSAARGALLPADMLVQAHAEEMILPKDISGGLRGMIDAGGISEPRAIASPHSFTSPSFDLPESLARANSRGDQYNEFHLHHNGPDAKEVLESELVPMILSANRAGHLESLKR